MAVLAATATVAMLVLQLLSGEAITGKNFQLLDVKKEIAETRITPSSVTNSLTISEVDEKQDESSWQLHLLHRDHVTSSNVSSYWYRLGDRLRRDKKRVAALYRRITNSSSQQASNYHVQDFGSDVVSGMEEGSGEYSITHGNL